MVETWGQIKKQQYQQKYYGQGRTKRKAHSEHHGHDAQRTEEGTADVALGMECVLTATMRLTLMVAEKTGCPDPKKLAAEMLRSAADQLQTPKKQATNPNVLNRRRMASRVV